MGRVVVSEFVSVDGVMENPAWTQPYWGDEQNAYKRAELVAADALLLGRVTYEGFAQAWPSATDEEGYADRINALPKHVTSSTPELPAWNGTAIEGDVVAAVRALREAPGQDLLVFGSAQLVQTLTREDLVDEFRLMVYPVVVGSGKKLFQDDTVATLKLVDATTFATGVVVLTYHPASEGRAPTSLRPRAIRNPGEAEVVYVHYNRREPASPPTVRSGQPKPSTVHSGRVWPRIAEIGRSNRA